MTAERAVAPGCIIGVRRRPGRPRHRQPARALRQGRQILAGSVDPSHGVVHVVANVVPMTVAVGPARRPGFELAAFDAAGTAFENART